ncbi:MAG: galactokinase [Phycisphaerae bacterium]|nr:galactokinase [Phycisphaerae bacterium]
MVNVESLLSGYRRRFDGAEPTVCVRAPGRVNLIGEHVDYNDGLVLPIAIDRAVYGVAGPAEEDAISVFSASIDETAKFDLEPLPRPLRQHGRLSGAEPGWHRCLGGGDSGETSVPPCDGDTGETPAPQSWGELPRDGPARLRDDRRPSAPGWDAYPRGVASELAGAGVRLAGTRIYLDSDLPIGAGLSSSAALEVAVALALLSVAAATLSRRQLAHVCRLAEHRYAGVPCGIMDQFVCAMAVAGGAMLLDCRDEHTRHIPWPDRDATVLIVDSQCRHKLADGAYADRVRACSMAADRLRAVDPSVRSLRDVNLRQLVEQQSSMEAPIFRRARHVVTEIQRTRDAAEALQRGDFAAFGRAMNASHDSLRDDYEVSSPQLDGLVEVVRGVPGVFGARMTGAGFGGCVVAVAPRDAVPHVESAVRKRYDTKYGVTAQVMVTHPCEGATTTRLADS